jgi:acetyltransferase
MTRRPGPEVDRSRTRPGEGLLPLLSPQSVAVLGASRDRAKNSGKPLAFLLDHGYRGRIYPVNPHHAEVQGLRCYPSVRDLPESPDLVVIVVPADRVPAAVEECAQAGARAAVLLASGFAEVGEAGRVAEARIVEVARRANMRICGPNSVGIINAHERLTATFSQALERKRITPGSLALVSQSGNFGTFMVELTERRQLGFSVFVSSGNEADVSFLEYCDALIGSPQVAMIGGYVEGLHDGRRLIEVGHRALTAGVPLAFVKVGRGAAARAALSHTGAVVGSDQVYDGAFRQARVLRIRDEDELLDTAALLVNNPLPEGRRLAIVSVSGGGATMLADACDRYGLVLPTLGQRAQARLREVVPYFGAVTNPVDLTGQVLTLDSGLGHCLEAVLADSEIDAAVVFLGMMQRQGPRLATELLDVRRRATKPILVAWIAGPDEPVAQLRAEGLCVTTGPSVAAIRALGNAVRYAEWRKEGPRHRGPVRPGPSPARVVDLPEGLLTTPEAAEVLRDNGVPFVTTSVARSEEAAAEIARRLGFPVALKANGRGLAHKTEAGAVRLGLDSDGAVREAFRQVTGERARASSGLAGDGVVLQPMVGDGVEAIMGLLEDPQFGWIVSVGAGGVFTELLGRTAVRVAPVDRDEALAMVREVPALETLLRGFRGMPAADAGSLAEVISRFSGLPAAFGGRLLEAELNPVMARGSRVLAVDALIRLGPSAGSPR